jgi:hypothetical protein
MILVASALYAASGSIAAEGGRMRPPNFPTRPRRLGHPRQFDSPNPLLRGIGWLSLMPRKPRVQFGDLRFKLIALWRKPMARLAVRLATPQLKARTAGTA